MAEHVDEERPARPQPAGDPLEQRPVVADVLEHLDRHHPVERAIELQAVDVGRDHLDVGEPAGAAPLCDVAPLGGGVRDRGHPGAGEGLGDAQRQRAPAAAEIEDLLAVGDPGPAQGEVEHPPLRLVQGVDPRRPEAGAVLEVAAQDQAIELGRHLVVLFVGRLGGDRDGRAPEGGDQRLEALLALLRPAPALGRQALGHQAPDAEADGGVGQGSPLGHLDQPGRPPAGSGSGRGGEGDRALIATPGRPPPGGRRGAGRRGRPLPGSRPRSKPGRAPTGGTAPPSSRGRAPVASAR